MRPMQQVLRRHALQDQPGKLHVIERQVLWNLDQFAGWVDPLLTIGAEGRQAGADPLANGEVTDAGTDLLDYTNRLHAEYKRRLANDPRVRDFRSVVGIREVQPNGRTTKAHLARAGTADRNFLPYQVVRSTLLMNHHCHCHDAFLLLGYCHRSGSTATDSVQARSASVTPSAQLLRLDADFFELKFPILQRNDLLLQPSVA
jgi:hypothetical protein